MCIRDSYIFNGDVELDVSAITQKGLEYGVNLGVRAQYDPFRRGFGGRVPLCPPILQAVAPQEQIV